MTIIDTRIGYTRPLFTWYQIDTNSLASTPNLTVTCWLLGFAPSLHKSEQSYEKK